MIERALDFLSPFEHDLLTADCADLVTDPEVGGAATYRQFQSAAFTPSSGAATKTYTDYSVRIIKNDISVSDAIASQGLYQAGDVHLTIPRSILAVTPETEDLIVIDGVTYKLLGWDTDPLGFFWQIVARKVS